MQTPSFSQIKAFLAVADHCSFVKAAASLSLAPSTLSSVIRNLEKELGVQLFNRTTRSVALTEIGEHLRARLQPTMEDYMAAIESINDLRDRPKGKLRLSVPRSAANFILRPLVTQFLQEYPDITVEISSGTSDLDIVAGGFDAGIRVGDRVNVDMIAIQISEQTRGTIVGSPEYFASNPEPTTLQDLFSHNCIRFREVSGGLMPWRLTQGERNFEPLVNGNIIVNDTISGLNAAVDGIGLLYMARDQLAPLIESGDLVPVLKNCTGDFGGHFLCYPTGRHRPPALRAFVSFVRREIRQMKKGRRSPLSG